MIPAGSPCGVATGIWSRKARTFRWCLPCDLLRREVLEIIRHFDDEPLVFGELLMHVRECL